MIAEKDLYSPLVEGAQLEGWNLFRITDGSFGLKPFDLAGSDNTGRAVGVEIKCLGKPLSSWDEFPWSRFSQHQIEWLKAYTTVNALALVGIYEQSTQRFFIYPITSSLQLCPSVKTLEMVRIELIKINKNIYTGWNQIQRGVLGIQALRARVLL